MRKSVVAAAMAASLTVGGAAGAALFVPSLSGAQEGDTTTAPVDDTRPEPGSFLEDALAPLVEANTIDQSQADAVIAAIRDARPEGGFRHGPGRGGPGPLGDGVVADAIGVTPEELRAALADGQTIAEVAEAHDVSVDDVVAAIVAAAQDRLDTAVENGRLTEDEAAERVADITEHATDLVNGTFEFDGRGPRHGRPGPFGGPDAPADDTTGS